MVAIKGRPHSDNPKDYMLRTRIDKETLERLDKCCQHYDMSRSEIVRQGILEQYGKIKK